jgi:hypothetical protein
MNAGSELHTPEGREGIVRTKATASCSRHRSRTFVVGDFVVGDFVVGDFVVGSKRADHHSIISHWSLQNRLPVIQ